MVTDSNWSYCSDHFIMYKNIKSGFPGGAVAKNLPTNAGDTLVRALVREDPTHRGATKPVRPNY